MLINKTDIDSQQCSVVSADDSVIWGERQDEVAGGESKQGGTKGDKYGTN